MRIVLVSTHFPPTEVGGSAESVRLTAVALGLAGHQVTVVTPAWSPQAAPEGPYRVVPVPMPWPTDHGSERRFLDLRYHATFGAAVAALAPEADMIHAQDRRAILATRLGFRGKPSWVTLRDVGLLCPVGLCLWDGEVPHACQGLQAHWQEQTRFLDGYHGGGFQSARRARLWLRRGWLALERKIAKRFDGIAFVSEGLRLVHHASGFQAEMEAILPSPIEPPLCPPGAGVVPAALFVGKASIGKGWGTFTDAARRRMDLVFAYAGSPVQDSFPRNVLQLGWIPRDWLGTVYRRARCVVVPSICPDGLPRVALEAQAAGGIVIGSDAGGIPETFEEGVTGFGFPRGDARALADRIHTVCELSPGERHEFSVRAQERAERLFGLRAVVKAHAQAYS